jgi:hypothetical protein
VIAYVIANPILKLGVIAVTAAPVPESKLVHGVPNAHTLLGAAWANFALWLIDFTVRPAAAHYFALPYCSMSSLRFSM